MRGSRSAGSPEEALEAAIAELIEIGELNDERYAEFFCADKRELAGWGPERIAATLADRGVDQRLIDRFAPEDRGAQVERAAALVRERGDDLSDDRGRARAFAYLNRRGFDYEVAYDAIRPKLSASARRRLRATLFTHDLNVIEPHGAAVLRRGRATDRGVVVDTHPQVAGYRVARGEAITLVSRDLGLESTNVR